MKNSFGLENKVVAISGGAGIIGKNMVSAMLAQGAKVVILERNIELANSLLTEYFTDFNAERVIALECDITQEEQLRSVYQAILDTYGPVTTLVNNAASKSDNFFEPFESFPEEDWDFIMGVNVKGPMLSSKVFGAEMVRRGIQGSIINTLSIYGIVAPDQRIYEGSEYEGRAINTPAVYSASKAALWGLTKYLSTYWGDKGIRVNAITPGGVFSGQNDTFVERYSARIPLGRMAEETELSGALVFLASEASSYVTGQNIIVDGGLTVW